MSVYLSVGPLLRTSVFNIGGPACAYFSSSLQEARISAVIRSTVGFYITIKMVCLDFCDLSSQLFTLYFYSSN